MLWLFNRTTLLKIVSAPDVMQSKPDTSAFIDKRLPIVTAGEIKNHLNEVIITGGRVVATKIDVDNSVLLYINGSNAVPAFAVLIKNTDRNKFDLPERHFYGKWIKVAGKVIAYKGNFVINITKENEILVVTR